MVTPARVFRKLEGLFAVYKPSGIHWKLVRDNIEANLLKGENETSRGNVTLALFLLAFRNLHVEYY